MTLLLVANVNLLKFKFYHREHYKLIAMSEYTQQGLPPTLPFTKKKFVLESAVQFQRSHLDLFTMPFYCRKCDPKVFYEFTVNMTNNMSCFWSYLCIYKYI